MHCLIQSEQVDRVAIDEAGDHVRRHVGAAKREGRINGAREGDGSGPCRHCRAEFERAGIDYGATDEGVGGGEVDGPLPGDDQRAGAGIAE